MTDWHVLTYDPTVGDATRMLPELLQRMGEAASHERRQFWERMGGAAEVRRRQEEVRARFLASLGEFPERTPLNPQVVGCREFAGYTLEKLIYESRPRYSVPANLYLPHHGVPPFPTVLVSCGHYESGKAAPDYQRTAIGLALKGCLVMVVDPMGQGERQDSFDPLLGKSMLGGPVMEHHYAGDPGYLLGIPFPQHRLWDKIRALDFLCARDDVDRERLACVGHSGGGAMALLMAASDDRIRLTVGSSPGGSCEWTILPPGSSTEERLTDMLTLFAPRPLLIYFGEEEPGWPMAQRLDPLLGRIYAALGARERLRIHATPGGHDHDGDKREALYGWIDQWFLGGRQGAAEPHVEALPEEAVRCTSTGQVLSALGGRALWMVHRDLAREIRPERALPTSADQAGAYQEAIRSAIRRRAFGSGSPSPTDLDARVLNASEAADGRVLVERLAFSSEEGIRIPALFFRPVGTTERYSAIVFVDERGKSAEAEPSGLFETLARHGHNILAIDVRGLGETALPGAPYRDATGLTAHGSLFGHDAVHAVRAMNLGRPLFGMRVLDALRAVEYLRSRPEVGPTRVRIAGRGVGALIALYAAALDERIAGAIGEEGLLSYESVVSHPEYSHFMNVFLPGVLRDYDLRDVAACVAPRPLLLLNVVDHARRWMEGDRVESEYEWARRVYVAMGVEERLVVRSTPPQHEAWRRELYRWWLGDAIPYQT